jgi:hypothetical protein
MGFLSDTVFSLEQDHQRFIREVENARSPSDCNAQHPVYDNVTCVRSGSCSNSHLGILTDRKTNRKQWIEFSTETKESPLNVRTTL